VPNQGLTITELKHPSGALWEEVLGIYRETFPAWEREPEDTIAERIVDDFYRLRVGILQQRVIGFYLLDLNTDPSYAMLCFLAIDPRHRRQGLGGLLCRDAMTYFNTLGEIPWLLVEAKDRQAAFYGRAGFFKLSLDYRAPRFDGPGSMPMQLMLCRGKGSEAKLSAAEWRPILHHIFLQGYQLHPEDQRITDQLARVDNDLKLIAWLPHEAV
jgi:GNAT superfamily N-acetyltransferase